ncbi:MAG: helix-turn-helix transcriptional regulator [Terriglobales bacterium]
MVCSFEIIGPLFQYRGLKQVPLVPIDGGHPFQDVGGLFRPRTIKQQHNCGQDATFSVVPRKTTRTRKGLNPKVAFGTVLRRLREQCGDSQEGFAHRAGYHRTYIGQLERGEKSPSLSALFNIAHAFGMRPSEVVRQVEKLVPH